MLAGLLLPLFLLAAGGWLLARTAWLRDGWQHGLADVTSKVLLPAFLFNGAYVNGLPAAVSWQIMVAFYLPLLLLFALAAWVSRRDPGSALAATYSNNVFVGLPVLMATFGGASLQYAFPIIAFHTLLTFLLYFLAQGGARPGRALSSTLTNPIVMSLMAGLVLHFSGLQLPAAAAGVLAMLAAAALPCTLLALGASLARLELQKVGASAGVAAVKLLLLPALVLGAGRLLGVAGEVVAVLVVMAACPVGVNAGALVQAEGKDASVVSSAILLSSVACMATIPLWIWILSLQ